MLNPIPKSIAFLYFLIFIALIDYWYWFYVFLIMPNADPCMNLNDSQIFNPAVSLTTVIPHVKCIKTS